MKANIIKDKFSIIRIFLALFLVMVFISCSGGSNNSTQSDLDETISDTQAPTTPSNLTALAVSSSQIDLSWSASTDNVGVSGYRIYRDGTELTTVSNFNYSDTEIIDNTSYSYTVSAYDAAGNESIAASVSVSTSQQQPTMYVAVDGNGTGDSESDPCNFDYAKVNAGPGDVIALLAGDYGDRVINADDTLGTNDNRITYRSWPNELDAGFTSLVLSGSGTDFYLTFSGIDFNPGYTDSSKIAVRLIGVNYIKFDSCYFEGAKVAATEGLGDFAPHSFENNSTINSHYATPSNYITITKSEFKYGNHAIRINGGDNWTITNNDISEWTDNGVQISAGFGNNTQISYNTIHDANLNRGIYHWDGAGTGDWSDKESQTITQDGTNASAILYKIEGARFYIYPDDADNIPARNTTEIWRLDSNPNIFWTPSGTGDNCHNDGVSIEGTGTNITINNNHLYNTGQAIKLGRSGGYPGTVLIENNLFNSNPGGTYIIYLEAGTDVKLYNNTIYAGEDNSLHGIRTSGSIPQGEPQRLYLEMYNNIISGGVYGHGVITSNSNIWDTTPPDNYNEGGDSLIGEDFTSGIFADINNNDFKLSEGSPAIDKADPTYAPAMDFLETSRDDEPDIGAYEYR